MYAQVEKTKMNTSSAVRRESRAIANSVGQQKSNLKQRIGFVDNRLDSKIQGNVQRMMRNSSGNVESGTNLGASNMLMQNRYSALPIQLWRDYSTDYAVKMADGGKVKIHNDRVQHAIDHHGPDVVENSAKYYTFISDDSDTIKGYRQYVIDKGKAYKGPGGAFDFQTNLNTDIGKNKDEEKTKRMRVVVVESPKNSNRGKVQTAYPIAE